MQMEILMSATSLTDVSVRTELLMNTLDHVIWRRKSLMFNHHMKEMKAIEAIKDLIQILRFLIFQLHLCDINGPIIKIICFREIYLSLTKKLYTERKIYFYYHLDKQKRIL